MKKVNHALLIALLVAACAFGGYYAHSVSYSAETELCSCCACDPCACDPCKCCTCAPCGCTRS